MQPHSRLYGEFYMANEKKTDIIVAQMLDDAGIRYTPNGSDVEEISLALSSSSKRGTGKKGYPEFVAVSNGIVIVIEDKPDVSRQAQYMDELSETLLMDVPSIRDYAENGAVHYAQNIVAKTSFKLVVAIGCSGSERGRLRIRPIFVSVNGYKLLPYIRDFAQLAPQNIERYYNEVIRGNEPIEQVELKEVLKRSAKLHEDLRNYANLGETEKPLVVSAILLALNEPSFSTEQLTGDSIKTDGMKIFDALSTHMERVEVKPAAKKQMVLNQFNLIRDRSILSEIDSRLGKTPLRYFAEYLDSHIISAIQNNSPEDVLGRFYGEFIKYSGGDGQTLGVVLTPKHITELMAELVEVRAVDKVLDPCCGTGSFLIAAMNRMLQSAKTDNERKEIRTQKLYGIELRENMFAIATTNMIMRGDGKSNLRQGDFFREDVADLQSQHFTVGLMNPPYSQGKNKTNLHLSELKFICQLLDVLAPEARCAVIVPQSVMAGTAKEDRTDKQYILNNHTLEGVITLNSDTFYGVGVSPVIAVFTAHKAHPADKLCKFVDFKNDGYELYPHVGLLASNDAVRRRKHLMDVWKQGMSEHVSFIVRCTIRPEDEWLHSYYYFNEDIPNRQEFGQTVADYRSFEFSQIAHGRGFLFEKQSQSTSYDIKWTGGKQPIWKPFHLSDLFKIEKGNQNNMNSLQDGQIPLVSARNQDNGYKRFVADNGKKRFCGHCLTLNIDGDGGAGIAYYQPSEMMLDSHVVALIPKIKMSRNSMLFISRCITKQRTLFGHARSINTNRQRIFQYMLPVDESGNPYFAYMDSVIADLEQEQKELYMRYQNGND